MCWLVAEVDTCISYVDNILIMYLSLLRILLRYYYET